MVLIQCISLRSTSFSGSEVVYTYGIMFGDVEGNASSGYSNLKDTSTSRGCRVFSGWESATVCIIASAVLRCRTTGGA